MLNYFKYLIHQTTLIRSQYLIVIFNFTCFNLKIKLNFMINCHFIYFLLFHFILIFIFIYFYFVRLYLFFKFNYIIFL